MNLCLDIGNSSSKLAVFKRKKLVFNKRYKRLPWKSILAIIKTYDVSHTIISSTRHLNKELIQKLKRKSKVIVLDHTLNFSFKIKYQTPETLGRDRIAGIAGAWANFRKQNSLLADLGTCNTYDFISAQGIYLGGNIAPGLNMRLKAMDTFTDKLPYAAPENHDHLLGMTTTEALQNGAVKGIILEIEGYIRNLKREFGTINVILTGGDSAFFAKHFKKRIFAEPNIVLQGLNDILNRNS